LRKAMDVELGYQDAWLSYCIRVLLATYKPGTKQTVEIKLNPAISTTSSATTSSATTRQFVLPQKVAK